MPSAGLKLIPSVNAEFTPSLNQSAIDTCNLIRFKSGLPQKLGGWEKFYAFSLAGIPRDLIAWQDLNAVDHLGTGTTTQLGVITSGVLSDITPQTFTSNIAPDFTTTATSQTVTIADTNITNVTIYDAIFLNTPISVGGTTLTGTFPIALIAGAHSYDITALVAATSSVPSGGAVPAFTVTSGSAIVTVAFAKHGLSVGDDFTFPISTTVGGIAIAGTYVVLSVPTADTFTIAGNTLATSSTSGSMNGGLAQILYYINLGPPIAGAGFGLGGYGSGGYGSGSTPVVQTGTPITATDWTTANWGEVLLSCPENGGIFQWGPSSGFVNAGLISSAPIFNSGIFIAMPEQILIAYGSTAGITGLNAGSVSAEQQDPLTIRWSDILDFTTWIPSTTNQAGSYRIPRGSKIVGGLQGPHQAFIWTDIGVWAMSYLGYPLVFGFDELSSGCGLIGKHAAAVMQGAVYWMSTGNFFMIGSAGVQPIPCSVWDIVFQDLDTANQHKCRAAPNSAFNEMWFFYPSLSGGTGECDKYVKVNTQENFEWDYGTLSRSAWIDQSVLGEPIGATPSGVLYQHETSFDADGAPLVSWFETGWFAISDGEEIAFVDWFFPDMKWGYANGAQSATVSVTITSADYPNGTQRVYGPFNMTAAKTFINLRLRGRLIKLKFESDDIGSFWRLGLPRYRFAIDGRL
ncbi:MAG: hypothetical protein KGL39_06390 [Patescibacteria group bacterium]|nr:hypothetical protein [Patescibacteria group bacterium]